MHILGTAGHVDHGKSSLVRALTGTDPDRWIEEKLRGMTLDLGFAHLRFPDGVEAGIIDVPGHERFLHNMLAGAAGMELLLLVVAANEGPKPQTIEHLSILSYLNVRSTIVVLTKSDLVDREELALAEELLRGAMTGTVAEGAPILPVSTVTGEGLEALRMAIHSALSELPPRAPEAPAFLPVDRVFVLPGHGTIVTGTLMQGELAVGDTLRLSPLGRDVRIRSLQVFGEPRERVAGGVRVAANLSGVDTTEIHRGAVLASRQFNPERSFDVTFKPYRSALQLLRRRTQVRAYVGSAEVLGLLEFETHPLPSGDVSARLHLREPVIGLPGAAFVVRRASPKDLLGGGTFKGARATVAAVGNEDEIVARVVASLRDAGLEGANAARIGAMANVREQLVAEVLLRLHQDGRACRLVRPEAYVAADVLEQFKTRVQTALERREAAGPWMMGTTSLTLSRDLDVPEALVARALTALAEEGWIASRAGYYSTVGFTPQLTREQKAFFDRELAYSADQPYLPVSLPVLVAHMKAVRITGLSQAFDTLVASGAVVKVGEAAYRGEQISAIQQKLQEALRKDGHIAASTFRDIVGTSRKYAVPLLEWFDSMGITVRSGDVRVLRGRTHPVAVGFDHREDDAQV